MTESAEEPRGWKETAEDWVWARWRWLIALVVLLFVLNNLAGTVVGVVGLMALGNRVAGRLLKARRVLEQVRGIVADSDDVREDVEGKGG